MKRKQTFKELAFLHQCLWFKCSDDNFFAHENLYRRRIEL